MSGFPARYQGKLTHHNKRSLTCLDQESQFCACGSFELVPPIRASATRERKKGDSATKTRIFGPLSDLRQIFIHSASLHRGASLNVSDIEFKLLSTKSIMNQHSSTYCGLLGAQILFKLYRVVLQDVHKSMKFKT